LLTTLFRVRVGFARAVPGKAATRGPKEWWLTRIRHSRDDSKNGSRSSVFGHDPCLRWLGKKNRLDETIKSLRPPSDTKILDHISRV
jgi:hypothetical protein